ncbi:protein unc-45 homolog B-like, partial [Oppia nitens]|uniref:protein unc-45 homolog B-like n=1 Tax=Oppia nitens TaxID=1686743 RepID=UPI0023D98D83
MPQIQEISDELDGKELQVLSLKESGNQLVKSGDYKIAINEYLKALSLSDNTLSDDSKTWQTNRLNLYKNLSLCYLKLEDYENTISYATKALELSPTDIKTLLRRCSALETMQRYSDAFKDALNIQHLEPNNMSIKTTLRRLNAKIQELVKQNSSISSRMKQMFDYLTDDGIEADKRLQSANNLMVLVRENAGKRLFIESNGLQLISKILNSKCDANLKLALIRTLTELSNNSVEGSLDVLKVIGINTLIQIMSLSFDEQMITAIQYNIQTMIESLSGFCAKEEKKPNKDLMKKHETNINEIMICLTNNTNLRMMTGLCRDAILELLITHVDYQTLFWGQMLVQNDGLWKLLEIASELEEIRYESGMNITSSTRTHVSLLLDKVYLCHDHDKAREIYRDKVMDYINSKLRGMDIEDKVRATATITTLLMGPIDVGNYCLGQTGIMEMMLVMAGSDDAIQQCVAAEAIIAAASKKDKCTSLANMGTGILKKLFKSSNDRIKVRALVGLCKLGSVGGTDASIRTFSDESTVKLAKACQQFLVSPSVDKDMKKWSADGLAYLSLSAEIKEELIEDKEAITALVDLAKNGDLSVLFGVVTTFVNLTNSYEKQEAIPELKELAKFAKQHVPEDHPKDDMTFVEKRCQVLCNLQVVSALIALTKSQSKTSREMIARVFNAFCEFRDLRGIVVQQGGVKALLKLALESNTDIGKNIAGQALARIGITINPEVAFPGQRCCEVVRPLIHILHPDCSALMNFEALMALTNLAQVSPSVRSRIIKDSGFARIESYMYEDHELLKRSATQCLTNLIVSEDMVKMYEGDNDRVKYLVILAMDDDIETAKAASGALAMLTSVSKKSCQKIFEPKCWLECLIQLVSNKDTELQHRGVCIIYNLIDAGEDIAEKIIETQIFEILVAITRPEVDDIEDKIKDIVTKALQRAEELNIIKNIE